MVLQEEIMSDYKFLTPVEGLKATFKEFIEQGLNKKEIVRATVVYDYLCGVSMSTLSETYHIQQSSILKWVKKVDIGGWEALHSGRKKKELQFALPADTRKAVDKALQSNPYIYGYNLWDGRTLSDFLEKRYGIKFSANSCQELMEQLGYALLPLDEALKYIKDDEATYFHEKVAHFNISPSTRKRWVKIRS